MMGHRSLLPPWPAAAPALQPAVGFSGLCCSLALASRGGPPVPHLGSPLFSRSGPLSPGLPPPASAGFLPPRLLVTSRMFAVWGKVSFDAHSFLRFYQRQERWTKCLWSQSEGKFTGKVCPKEAKPRMIHLRQWSDVHACSVQHVKERERSPAPCLAVQRRHAP